MTTRSDRADSRGISAQLERHGYRLLGAPESFLVSKQGTLLEGEAERATAWGASVGEEAALACLASG
jgi:hypothetical protein